MRQDFPLQKSSWFSLTRICSSVCLTILSFITVLQSFLRQTLVWLASNFLVPSGPPFKNWCNFFYSPAEFSDSRLTVSYLSSLRTWFMASGPGGIIPPVVLEFHLSLSFQLFISDSIIQSPFLKIVAVEWVHSPHFPQITQKKKVIEVEIRSQWKLCPRVVWNRLL